METQTLTREAVMDMEAGPEIERLVQERVFGSTDLRRLNSYISGDDGSRQYGGETYGEEPYWFYLPKYDHAETGDEFCRPVPCYSTDIAAAMKVFEKAELKSIERHWDEWRVSGRYPRHRYDAIAGTIPLAICRAALLASL